MRKWLFALAFIFIFCLTVKATDVTFEPEIQIDETIGIIEALDWDYLHVSGEPLTLDGLYSAVINIGDAPIYDLITGLPVRASQLRIGMEVRVAYVQYDDDLPQAIAVWLHPSHKDAAVFTTIVSENIQYGPGYAVFLSQDGKYRVTLTSDTYIYDPEYGIITPEDVLPGQEYFVWVDMITASSPALVFPDKVVLICQ